MHSEIVILDRVFDVQRRKASRYRPRRTDFSFESGGKKAFAVQAPGWPTLRPGDRLFVFLREADNWQTVVGWKNLTTGELVLPHTSFLGAALAQGAFGLVLGYCWLSDAASAAGRFSAGAYSLVCLVAIGFVVARWCRKRAQSRLIIERKPFQRPKARVQVQDGSDHRELAVPRRAAVPTSPSRDTAS